MNHLAIDIGAESGRAVLGWCEDGHLKTREVFRFPNGPVRRDGTLRWDIATLEENVRKSVEAAGVDLASVGIDTWAVDYVLLDAAGNLIQQPYAYRDKRTEHAQENAYARVPAVEIYGKTGIQLMPFNTLFQLVTEEPEVLARAATFLTIPDYLNFLLTGGQAVGCEFTNATTTQCYDPSTDDWAYELLEALGIPAKIFPKIVKPGTIVGRIPNSNIQVVAPACHDTGSAVAGIPITLPHSAWISSGTWSILGAEVPKAVVDYHSFDANFTNEGGVGGTFRLSKNVSGMWIIQELRRGWGGDISYAHLSQMAEAAPSMAERIDPDDTLFFAPDDMAAAINSRVTVPITEKGAMVRLVIESLADRYCTVLSDLEEISSTHYERIHVVGGGSQNALLNQLTATACQRELIAGPVEATALGNLMMQMIALGEIDSIAQGRALIARSFPTQTFKP